MTSPSSSFLLSGIPRRFAGPFVLLALLCGEGCARRAPSGPPLPFPLEEASQRLEPIRRQALAVARYQAVVRVRGRGPEGRFSGTLMVAFERPERLRVELLGPFGSSRWIALVAEGEITVLFPSRREFVRESAVPAVLDALVGVGWSPDEAMAVLAGAGLPLDESTPTTAFQERDTVRVNLAADCFLRLRGPEVIEASKGGYRVRYPAPWRSKGKAAPERIEVVSEDISATLAVSDLDINVPLDAEVFRLEIPAGTSRVGLREIGGEAFFFRSER